jgi:hypothetical protein
MLIADHAPHAWILFQTETELLLDVNCNHSAAGYSILIRLNDQETADYNREGHSYLDRLARSVQDAGPGSVLQGRDVTNHYAKQCAEAFAKWRAVQN